MTHWAHKMDDAVDHFGRPWRVDTLRIWHNDDRQCWSVSEPFDEHRNDALCSWHHHGGERFDGKEWKLMCNGDQP